MKSTKLVIIAAMAAIGLARSNDCNTLEKCQEVLKNYHASSLIHFESPRFTFRKRIG